MVGIGIFLLIYQNSFFYLEITLGITIAGFIVSGTMEKLEGKKDPSCVVIDEVSGMLFALIGLPATAPIIITAYFLFRAFDMFKIYPANLLESKKGSFGIMADDIVAGIYTNLVMHAALFLLK